MTASTTRRSIAAKTRTLRTSRTAALAATAVAGAMLLTACGDQTANNGASDKETKGAETSAAPLADKLPQAIRDKGVIKVGSDIAYAPVEFKDEDGKTVGIDPDLAAAMGKQLGVTFEFENGTFDTLITGLRAKRYDMAMSAMTDTKDRQEVSTRRPARRSVRASTSSTTSTPVSRSTPRRATTRASRAGPTSAARRSSSSAAPSPRTWPRTSRRSARRTRRTRSRSRPSTPTSRPRPACARAAPTPAPPTSRSPRTR